MCKMCKGLNGKGGVYSSAGKASVLTQVVRSRMGGGAGENSLVATDGVGNAEDGRVKLSSCVSQVPSQIHNNL